MQRSDGADIHTVSPSGLGQRIVARVKILALLEVAGKVLGLRRAAAIKAEETGFLGGERLFHSFSELVFCV